MPTQPDSTFSLADTNDADLANFFSRPVKIREFAWVPGTPVFENWNPWTDYFTNTRVMNRISNYNLLRATLHVKFMVNGNAFQYGRILVSYNPVTEGDQVSRSRAFFAADAVEESQRPHIFLNPTVSLGGTLVLPFIWYNNALSIPQAEWTQMGTISMRTLQTLESANGALSGTNISVFAWAEDVSLAIPTSANPAGLLPQSGDEYTSGTISTPAAVVAGVARNLSMIPVLRPYALASEMLATTTVAIAKALGIPGHYQLLTLLRLG